MGGSKPNGLVVRIGWALLAMAPVAAPLPASAQIAGPSTDAALAASLDSARAAFDRLPEADRIAIQDALVWTGDYSSAADGSFGRRSFEAIQAYQRRNRQAPTGILDPAGISALVAAGARVRNAAGFAAVLDPPTGIRLGIPQKLLPKQSANGAGGSRFQSADGRVTLDTRALDGDGDALRGIYERNLAIQSPGRTVTYRLLRPDFFVVSGETANGKFFSRYAVGPAGIRAMSIGYDKALAADIDRIVVAVANSFTPFPPAAGIASGGPGPVRPPLSPSRRSDPASVQTGLAVTPNRVLTAAAGLASCREPQVDGAPARLVTADAALALLETTRPHRTVPLALASAAPEETALVLFLAPGEGGKAVAAPAQMLGNGRLVAPLQPGGAGAVLLDRAGAVLGIVSLAATGSRAVAGLVPPASHGYAGSAEIARFLGPDAPAAAKAGDAPRGGAAAAIAPALASVSCAGRGP
ncbi:peptidoglycan-binding domain-containing protein [uncultured Enterovirga sp.]|uniref:peptidoglycan-binding domain-containing protein n=1 Tax=uncultured Enterovirga sp. TaxID=2026352 RepID=UPI0035CAB7C5